MEERWWREEGVDCEGVLFEGERRRGWAGEMRGRLLLFLFCLLLSEGGGGRRGRREEVRLAVGKTFTFSYDVPPAPPPAPPPTTDAQLDQRRRKKSLFGGKWIARVTRNRHCRLSFPLSTHVPAPLDPPNRNAWKKEATKQFLVCFAGITAIHKFANHFLPFLFLLRSQPLQTFLSPDPFLRVPACSCLCQITVHTQPPRGTIYLLATLTSRGGFLPHYYLGGTLLLVFFFDSLPSPHFLVQERKTEACLLDAARMIGIMTKQHASALPPLSTHKQRSPHPPTKYENRHIASCLTSTRGTGGGAWVGVVGIQGAYRTPQSEKHAMLLISPIGSHCCNNLGFPSLSLWSYHPSTQRHYSMASAARRRRTECCPLCAPRPFFWRNRTDATEGRQVLIIKQHHLTPLPPSLHPWHHTTGSATYSSTRVTDEPVRTPRAKSEQRVRHNTH